jgi:hypothetical protein
MSREWVYHHAVVLDGRWFVMVPILAMMGNEASYVFSFT